MVNRNYYYLNNLININGINFENIVLLQKLY